MSSAESSPTPSSSSTHLNTQAIALALDIQASPPPPANADGADAAADSRQAPQAQSAQMHNAPGGRVDPGQDFRAAGLYMLVAILLILFNKACFSIYDFRAPNVLTLSQNVCSLVFLLACKRAKLIEFHDFSMRNFRKMFLLGLTFILYMVFGMIAMKVVNIPMYTTLRRTTVVFVMGLEWIMARKTSSLSIKVSVGLMIVGALVAGVHDLNFDVLAYAIVMIYNLCTAMYLVLINKISTAEKLLPANLRMDKYDFMFYNNLISIPLLLVIIWMTDETSKAASSPYWFDAGFLVSLLASSSLAFVLNYAIFWNTAVNSALTQTVSGQAKDVVVVIAGFLLFTDAVADPLNILGVTIGFGGSIFYAMTKIVPTCTVEHALQRMGVQMASASTTAGLPFAAGGGGEVREERESLLHHHQPHHPSAFSSPESSPTGSPIAGGGVGLGLAQKTHSPAHLSAGRN